MLRSGYYSGNLIKALVGAKRGAATQMTDGKPWIKWQAPIRRVLYALAPVIATSIYFYGWRVLLLLAVVNIAGVLAEWAFTRTWKEPVSSAVLVTNVLFCCSLPPTIPFWIAVVGIVFGVVFGKMVFGGFGKNIFNPALTGRAFIYASFGDYMTSRWMAPVPGPFGGFAAYTNHAVDAVTTATPGGLMKTGATFSYAELLLGNTSGVIGGTCAVLVILGGLYLVRTRAASYRIVVAGLLGYAVTQGALWLGGVDGAVNPLQAGLAGSLLIGIFFYATDPVSACRTNEGRWLYGAFIGAMSSLIAVFSAWPAGTMFAILLGNMFAPITDHAVKAIKQRGAAE